MVRKKLASAIVALSALQAGFAAALGLGEMTLESSLNQPLRGEIKLLNVGNLDETQIIIQLAGSGDFVQAGIDRDFFLSNLEFDVELDARGNGVIVVRSEEKVVEPYLNFLLEARWPSGRLLREYTVLLDLPTFSDSAAPVTESATVARSLGRDAERSEQRSQPAASSAPAPRETPASAPTVRRDSRQPTDLPAATGQQQYRVQHNDTMWEIAERFRPSSDVSVQQTMLALQRHNPEAFIRGNINLVKSGYVLRLPTADQIREMGFDQAVAEVKRHNQAWRSGTSVGSDAVAGPQLDASGDQGDDSDDGGYREQARLSIATGGDSAEGGAGDGQGGAALRSQLDSALENLDRAKRNNSDLESRLDDMERQIATLQRLIDLKDDQLSALQGQAGEEIDRAELLAGSVDREGSGITDGRDPDGADTDGMDSAAVPRPDATTDTGVGDSADEPRERVDLNYAEDPTAGPQPEAEAEPAAQPSPPPAAPQPEPGLVDRLLANPLMLGAFAGLLILLVAIALLLRRRRANAEEEAAFADDEELAPLSPAGEQQFEEEDDDIASLEDFDEEPEALDEEPESEAEKTPTQPVRSETGDAIAEADIYIAYGRYQQAADLLSGAIDSEPERSDLRVKLIEVYLETGDRAGFERQYAALQEQGDDAAIVQVKEMMSSVDGVSDWLSGAAAAGAGAAAAHGSDFGDSEVGDSDNDRTRETPAVDDGLELGGDPDSDQATGEFAALDLETTSLEGDGKASAEDLDLDLDLDESTADTGAEDEEFDLDLSDLDGGDYDTTLGEEPATGASDDSALDLETDAMQDTNLELDGDDELAYQAPVSDDTAGSDQTAEAGEFDLDLGGDDDFDLELDNLDSGSGLDDLDSDLKGSADTSLQSEEFEPAPPQDSAEPAAEPEASPEPAPAAGEDEGAPDLDSDFDFLADTDEVATKLDLARAYIDMGDTEGAREILDEVLQEGTDEQKSEAQALIDRSQ